MWLFKTSLWLPAGLAYSNLLVCQITLAQLPTCSFLPCSTYEVANLSLSHQQVLNDFMQGMRPPQGHLEKRNQNSFLCEVAVWGSHACPIACPTGLMLGPRFLGGNLLWSLGLKGLCGAELSARR